MSVTGCGGLFAATESTRELELLSSFVTVTPPDYFGGNTMVFGLFAPLLMATIVLILLITAVSSLDFYSAVT